MSKTGMPKSPEWMIFALAALVGVLEQGVSAAADPFLHCTTDVRAAAIQPANTPILITIRITNGGDDAVPYGTGTGNPYPEASLFKAKITDSKGQTQDVSMFNDNDIPGSRWLRHLKAGESIDMPAMIIDRLPVGSYTLQVRRGKSAKVTIKEDIEVARKWDEDLLANICKGELFANKVAELYLVRKQARPFFIDGLLRDLSCDNEVEAERAARTLNRAPQLPAKAEGIVNQAIQKYLRLFKERGSAKTSILDALASLAAKIGTDEALQSVLALARTPQVRGTAIWPLGRFKQEKAAQELRLFLKDQNEALQYRAAYTLSERKDPQALELLLAVANDPRSPWHFSTIEALLKYPNDPRIEPAIKSGLDDPDPGVRQFAEFALRQLRDSKKR